MAVKPVTPARRWYKFNFGFFEAGIASQEGPASLAAGREEDLYKYGNSSGVLGGGGMADSVVVGVNEDGLGRVFARVVGVKCRDVWTRGRPFLMTGSCHWRGSELDERRLRWR